MKMDLLVALLAAQKARQPVATVTRVIDGVQSLIPEAGNPVGELSIPETTLNTVRDLIKRDCSTIIESDGSLIVRVYLPPRRLLIIGAVHIAQALAPMADLVGFAVIVIDPRRAFASAERFPGVRLVNDWPDKALASIGLDRATAIVTLSHDEKIDDPALAAALLSNSFYVGALGSTRTHAKRLDRLRSAGFGERTLERICAPVGLDIGGQQASEIAVSILAEVIQAQYRNYQ